MSARTEVCGSCRFWEPMAGTQGHCHYHAPAPVLLVNLAHYIRDDGLRPRWPLTGERDWCGQWQAKRQEVPGGPDR